MNSHESLGLKEVSKEIWTLFLPWNPPKSHSPTLRFGREVCERKRPPRSKPRHWKPLQQQQLLLLLWNVLTKAKCLIPALVLQFLVPPLSMLKALYLLLPVLLQRRKYTLSKWKKILRAMRQNQGEIRQNARLDYVSKVYHYVLVILRKHWDRRGRERQKKSSRNSWKCRRRGNRRKISRCLVKNNNHRQLCITKLVIHNCLES